MAASYVSAEAGTLKISKKRDKVDAKDVTLRSEYCDRVGVSTNLCGPKIHFRLSAAVTFYFRLSEFAADPCNSLWG
ncbi:hypothetical protein QA641_29045 [Bradyrhizobium sp. CB1650]|uniref:hypothetical protein n=1 Tax=Bradyrhizobium sp. CB1650 TaxID=3039153 RepID=UPI00243493F3|nr:hypothetical protein [Bradyrhizobium sp. CB1650]WGD49662.1 hypothetical protein QA641_29045 [Bradyrhizobium sp. CB1650]